MSPKAASRGFTLVEIMSVLAITAILATIAYPSYQDSVRKSRRADAKATLLELSQFMERNYTTANRYDQDSAGYPINTAALPFRESPKEGSTKYYDLMLDAVSNNTFTLHAVPKGDQTRDRCKTLTLNQAGAKNTLPAGLGDCW